MAVVSALAASGALAPACSRPTPQKEADRPVQTDLDGGRPSPAAGASVAAPTRADPSPPLPTTAARCQGTPAVGCVRFASTEDAFAWVMAHQPAVLGVGEAHAQKGTEGIASATKRFTETMVPVLAGKASDLLLEAWAGDPRCQRVVKQVASAQAPVKETQVAQNPNEYVAMGTRAKAVGIQPHLLQPTCDEYGELADAGADVITASLALIKRRTQTQALEMYQRNQAQKNGRVVVAYGGAMHNDLAPSEKLRAYSYGPEIEAATQGRYVELDLIVPEYIKKNEVWEKLPWFGAWEVEGPARAKAGLVGGGATLFVVGPRSFVIVFPASA